MVGQNFTKKVYQATPSKVLSMFDLLDIAVDLQASDLSLVPGYPPKFRMGADNLSYEEAARLGEKKGSETIRETKVYEPMAVMDSETVKQLAYSMLTTKRQANTFRMDHELDLSVETEKARFRVNVAKEIGGVYSTIRVIPYKVRGIHELGDFGLLRENIWEKIAGEDKGLILITGETNSGKSTTLASILQYIIDTQPRKVMTVEDPIEYALRPGRGQAVQREVGITTHSFNEAVKRFLRQNPDVIMVGEIRDEDTAKQTLRAAETGHKALTTLHTNDAPGSVSRMLDFLGNTEEARHRLADCTRYFISQKLIPRDKRTGNRTLAVEVMVVNDAIRNNIRIGKTENLRNIIQSGRDQCMMTMEQHLVYLVSKGLDREVAIREANNRKEMETLLRQK